MLFKNFNFLRCFKPSIKQKRQEEREIDVFFLSLETSSWWSAATALLDTGARQIIGEWRLGKRNSEVVPCQWELFFFFATSKLNDNRTRQMKGTGVCDIKSYN